MGLKKEESVPSMEHHTETLYSDDDMFDTWTKITVKFLVGQLKMIQWNP